MGDKIITQLSIFVNNEPGRLAHVASVMRECGINMRAFNLAESTEFGILRAIVEDPDESFEKIRATGTIVKKTSVIGIVIHDTPGSVFDAADILGKAGVNIEYGYAYNGPKAAFFVKVDDPEKAVELLEANGVELITDSEI